MAPFITPSSNIPSSIQLIIYIASSILYSFPEDRDLAVPLNPTRRYLTKEAHHDLYTPDAVTELIRQVTTVEDSCIVCLCQFQGEDEIRQLNTCRHIFHRPCLDRWIHRDQVLCPLCRTPFLS
ncbi:hypothetical protein MKW94_016879 [Papaver nudicaule]|uniref:RING-type domain-containing protein n=1 Tax=Papaver nudicaule TaxID=74823 RepID=A0AA41VS81_PAPNU|nr:hypothetical protein [Papaver nudicaule]